jgi:two-component system KDP operon response regulator KdpE
MNNKQKILIVEDEQSIINFVTAVLTANGYDVILAKTGAQAQTMVTSHCPDLVLLDLGLPDMDGVEIIRFIRSWTRLPIIVVSARTQERDKVEALDLGADDYISKPFGTSELLARIRTAMRHINTSGSASPAESAVFKTGSLMIDYEKRRVSVEENDVHLTQNEFKIVSLLSRHAGKVLTHDYIIKEIWGPGLKGDKQILRVNMANIRRKLEKNPAVPEYILTEVGVGYRMAEGDI